MSKSLNGKVAVVTGASKGIGAEIAKQLASAGAAVVVNYASSRSGADNVVAEITKAGGKAFAVQASVSKEADVVRLFEETKKTFGPVDVLVNNAGIYEFAPIEEFTVEHYRKQYDTNVLGLLLASREAVKQFGDRGGNIINVSSVVATLAPPQAAVYASTKGAVDVITRSLAKELGGRRIRVNAVNPGLVLTEGTSGLGFDDAENGFRKQFEAQSPLGRVGKVGDIAPAVVFLASDGAGWITGETLSIGGGLR
jgi:3-oxoacyl-[acyl-carrier protein] reductase